MLFLYTHGTYGHTIILLSACEYFYDFGDSSDDIDNSLYLVAQNFCSGISKKDGRKCANYTS
jgi:hypothetical protein